VSCRCHVKMCVSAVILRFFFRALFSHSVILFLSFFFHSSWYRRLIHCCVYHHQHPILFYLLWSLSFFLLPPFFYNIYYTMWKNDDIFMFKRLFENEDHLFKIDSRSFNRKRWRRRQVQSMMGTKPFKVEIILAFLLMIPYMNDF
jgi:hypothetical protein